ncbi:MAG TPA: hypothetical protein VM095_18860 [Pyrinomonadaceae bacterium]|nr:hypothetical protein [Pyrinomonadaceae bacterium]
MSEQKAKFRPVHENLDTAYVNLAALLHYLRQREFDGRVKVELDEYEADVTLSASAPPSVREIDHASGRRAEGDAALQRLLVRANEPGGLVHVYESSVEEEEAGVVSALPYLPPASIDLAQGEEPPAQAQPQQDAADWSELVRLSGELIATIERAALSARLDFNALFRAVRLGLADDYSFLDPATGRFEYGNGEVQLHARPAENAYISGVSEALRRVVNKISAGPSRQSVRERVALELAVLARRRQPELAKFKLTSQLDRIAGTRVL